MGCGSSTESKSERLQRLSKQRGSGSSNFSQEGGPNIEIEGPSPRGSFVPRRGSGPGVYKYRNGEKIDDDDMDSNGPTHRGVTILDDSSQNSERGSNVHHVGGAASASSSFHSHSPPPPMRAATMNPNATNGPRRRIAGRTSTENTPIEDYIADTTSPKSVDANGVASDGTTLQIGPNDDCTDQFLKQSSPIQSVLSENDQPHCNDLIRDAERGSQCGSRVEEEEGAVIKQGEEGRAASGGKEEPVTSASEATPTPPGTETEELSNIKEVTV